MLNLFRTEPPPLILSDCLDRYFAKTEGDSVQSIRTIEKYREASKHLLKNLGNIDLRKLTDEDITGFKQRLARIGPRPPGPSRKNTLLTVLKNVLKYLSEVEGHEVYDLSRIIKFKVPQKEVSFLTIEQLRTLVGALNQETVTGLRMRAIIESLFSTGCRISELLSLNREQINFETGVVSVRTKGDKPHRIIFNESSLRAIRAYLARRDDDCEALFATIHTETPKRQQVNDVERSLRNLGRKLGFNVSVTPHLIRRSAATYMFRQGVPLGVIQKFLNHSSSQVTTRFYLGSLDFEDLRESHEKVMKSLE